MNEMKYPHSRSVALFAAIYPVSRALLTGILTIAFLMCAQQAGAAPAATTTTLTVTENGTAVAKIAWGSVITLTATVNAGSSMVKTGQVYFCDTTAAHCEDIHLLGTAQLTTTGTAKLKFRPGIGIHRYKAIFLGTGNDATSTSNVPAINVIGEYPTATALTQRGFLGNYLLTATVAGCEFDWDRPAHWNGFVPGYEHRGRGAWNRGA
jgi:hypothetical protein